MLTLQGIPSTTAALVILSVTSSSVLLLDWSYQNNTTSVPVSTKPFKSTTPCIHRHVEVNIHDMSSYYFHMSHASLYVNEGVEFVWMLVCEFQLALWQLQNYLEPYRVIKQCIRHRLVSIYFALRSAKLVRNIIYDAFSFFRNWMDPEVRKFYWTLLYYICSYRDLLGHSKGVLLVRFIWTHLPCESAVK